MRSLLLLSAVLVAATAQSPLFPPHIVFAPENFYIGTDVTYSLTCYTDDCHPISLNISYQDCTCDSNGRQTCGSQILYSEDTPLNPPAKESQPIKFNAKMPSLSEVVSRRYYINLESDVGVFVNNRKINFYNNQFGHMLVKTDKPIYKPAQTVNICVVFLDIRLRPHDTNATVQVIIRDSKYRQILKTTVIVPAEDGVGCMDIELSDEPNLGTWRVDTRLVMDVGPGQCQFYRYSLPYSRCSFKVDEFVLPKYEVSLTGPKQITRKQNLIEGTVSATYTFGEQVQGTVRVRAFLSSSRESFPFYDNTAILTNGEYAIEIPASAYMNVARYRYDPFCVKSTIDIVAEVTESGRNTTQSAKTTIPLVSNPITVSFDDSNPNVFRPGLPYTVKGLATLADGSPAVGAEIQFKATANNGQIILNDRIFVTKRGGEIVVVVPLPDNINCLKFTMSPVTLEKSCDNQMICFSPSPMYSPTNSFLQLENTSPVSEISPGHGSKASITVSATFPIDVLHVVVIGQGNVQLHQASVTTGKSATIFSFTIPITYAGVPRVKVLGVTARSDGELVADLIEIPVTCQLEHEVDVSFGVNEAAPGDDISIVTNSEPDSVVLLSVIDKSLTLLADACKSVDKGNICRLLRDLTGGYNPASASCSVESETSCCPNTCSEPNKKAVADIFAATGIIVHTDMYQPRPPTTPSRRPFFPDYSYPNYGDYESFAAPAGPIATGRPPLAPTILEDDVVIPDVPEDESETGEIRDFFPESWVWEILRTNKSGIAVFESEVPDTITTWNAEAIAINKETGIGISPLTQLVVKKDVFVSLELPFSIIFEETVTITPIVFNFGSNANAILNVSVRVDSELELVENQLIDYSGLLSVARGTGTPFTIKLRPRSIGRLPILICIREATASPTSPCIDAVRKDLFVRPGCERFQITTNVYASDTVDGHCFDYFPPPCVIPGSAKATISITGDLLSPPDLDHLLVLPYGCGEQNMVRFSLNVVTGFYLMTTDQLTDVLSVKIRNNLQTGYQRQLTYLQGEGCFSIWSHGSCSLWLTAFTARFFMWASDPALAPTLGLSEQSELIDPVVITGAINYLINQQESSGRFPVIGRLHNYYLLQRDDFIGLTGYVLCTLLKAPVTPAVQNAIDRAESYIVTQYNDEEVVFCNYGLAITTEAMVRGGDPQYQTTVDAMVADLKSRIKDSKNYPGACFICNDCPDDDDEDSTPNNNTCSSRPRSEGSSSCVETTAYALKALLAMGDTETTVCLAQWLIQIKSGSGGFYSSQDTLVAVDALRMFAEQTFTKELNKTILVTINGLPPTTHVVTTQNRYERRDFQVPVIPSSINCVYFDGVGTAIIQSTLEYYGCSCCDDVQTFSLTLSTEIIDKQLALYILVSYLGEDESNMAIVDVEIPSGYVFTDYYDYNGVVERRDVRGSNVVFYINEIEESILISVEFSKDFLVENHQQVPVTVYDYYEPDQIVTKYYLPVDSGTIPTPPSNNNSSTIPTLPPFTATRPRPGTRPGTNAPPTEEE